MTSFTDPSIVAEEASLRQMMLVLVWAWVDQLAWRLGYKLYTLPIRFFFPIFVVLGSFFLWLFDGHVPATVFAYLVFLLLVAHAVGWFLLCGPIERECRRLAGVLDLSNATNDHLKRQTHRAIADLEAAEKRHAVFVTDRTHWVSPAEYQKYVDMRNLWARQDLRQWQQERTGFLEIIAEAAKRRDEAEPRSKILNQKAKVESLEELVSQQVKQLALLQSELRDLEKKAEAKERQIKKAKLEAEGAKALKKEVQDLKKELRACKSHGETLTREAERTITLEADLKQALVACMAMTEKANKVAALEAQIEGLKQELRDCRRHGVEMAEYKKKANLQEAHVHDLKKQLKKCKNHGEQLKKALAASETKAKTSNASTQTHMIANAPASVATVPATATQTNMASPAPTPAPLPAPFPFPVAFPFVFSGPTNIAPPPPPPPALAPPTWTPANGIPGLPLMANIPPSEAFTGFRPTGPEMASAGSPVAGGEAPGKPSPKDGAEESSSLSDPLDDVSGDEKGETEEKDGDDPAYNSGDEVPLWAPESGEGEAREGSLFPSAEPAEVEDEDDDEEFNRLLGEEIDRAEEEGAI
ncbi:MAG: hypothetical protein M1819_001758 [Sarea resinae]|nr:MAG: hypothetical protein M1819_001758 [Sarea resinae]